jgi:hypothetical protein
MPQDKVKEVYGLISDLGYFKDENEFKGYVSDPKRRKEAFDLISDTGYFKDENEFNSYFTDVVKPTPPPTGPQRETPQPRNKVAEMLNQPKAVDRLKQVVPTSEVTSGTKVPQRGVPVEVAKQKVEQEVKAKENLSQRVAFMDVEKLADDRKISTSQLFDETAPELLKYLPEDKVLEYELIAKEKILTADKAMLIERMKATNNPNTLGELNKTKVEEFKTKFQRQKLQEVRREGFNKEIAKLDALAKQMDQEGKTEVAEKLRQDILATEGERDGYFKNPNEQIQKIYSDNKSDMDEFQVPGNTPLERTKNYALILQKQIADLNKKMEGDGAQKDGSMLEGISKVFDDQYQFYSGKKAKLEAKLAQVAPIALLNQLPQRGDDGFFNKMTNTIFKELLPDPVMSRPENLTFEEIGTAIKANQISMSLSDDLITEGAIGAVNQMSEKPEAFSAPWWGELTGNSLALMPAFLIGNKASAAAKVPALFEKVAVALKAQKYGKYLSPIILPAEKGLEYAAAKPFLSENLADEASFLSGYLGQAISGPVGSVLSSAPITNLFNKMFGSSAPIVYNQIKSLGNRVSSGLGEYGEEVGNTLGPILETYIAGQDFGQLKKDLSENFGKLEPNLELFVGSVVMGMAMGGGSGIGKASMENSKKIYNQLPSEQQKKADDIANALKNDVEKAEVQAKKEEIQEGAEPLAEDILTEEDKQKKTEAIEKLNNPASTVAEKVEAGRVINDISIKEHDAKITEMALEEVAGEEVVSEEAVVETPSEEVAVEETKPFDPNEEAPIDETDIKRRRDSDKKRVMLDLKGSVNEADSYFVYVTDNDNKLVTLNGETKDEVISKVDEFYDEQLNNLKLSPTTQPQAKEEIVETPPSEVVSEEVITPKEEVGEVKVKNEGKANTPTKENITERLNINNPFYKKVEDALVKLGLIEKYNPETKTGDVIGGYAQQIKEGEGFAAGDMYFYQDGSISYIKGGVVVSFDKNGNVISENTKQVAQDAKKSEIEGTKDSITKLEKTRDSEAFKYKEVTETDILGNRKKVKRLKTQQELKESTDKINDAIRKAKERLAGLEQQVESPNEQTTPSKEQAKEVVSEEVKQETPKKEVVKEQPKKAPAKEKPLTAKEKQAEQEVIIKDRILGRLSAYNKLSAFQQKTKGPSAEIVDIFATASKYGFTIKDANVQKPNRTKKYELFKDGKKVGKSQTKSDIPEATPEQVKVAEKLIEKDLVTTWNGDQTAPRLDANTYGISWQEIRQGEKDIKAGKTNSAPAKRLIQVLNQIESDGEVNMVVGSGGAAMKMGYRLSEARQAIKEFPEITDSDMEEINANLDSLAKEYEEWFATTLTEQEQNNILEENESRNQSEISENAEVRQGETNVSNEKDGTIEKGEEVTPKTSDARKARIGEQLKVAEEKAKSLKTKLDKAQASLNKDKEAMQQNMFQANQISLLNDVDAKAKKVSNIKRDYDAAKEEVKSLKEQFDSLLEGQTEMDMDGNPALANVEATAKALEGKEISTKIKTTLKEINHFTDNKNFDFDKDKGVWFTTDKNGYVRRPNAKTKITRYIDEGALNLATEKQAFLAGDGDFEKGLKELQKEGYDGVKTKNNNSTEYYIFDVNKTQNRQELISEAYHKAKADDSNPELVKAVEDLLSEQPTKKSKPSKKEIQELSSIGVTNFNLPNLVEEVKQMSKTEFVAAKGSEFESKEQAESYWEDTRNGIFNKEVSDLKNTIDIEVRKSRNDLGSFKVGSGKMWTAMGKLMGLYVKKGVTSFGDFIKATGYKATSAMKGLWDSIRGRKSTIKLSTKNANIRNINARLFYTEALDGIPSTDDAQVILDALKDTIDVYKTMSIHAAKNDVQDINNATDALTDLYVELSSDLESVKKRIAEELELGQKVFEAEKKLSVSEKLAEFFADDFRWQEKMQKEIEKTKGTLSDDMNPYIQKDIAIGRMADTVNRVYQKIFGKTYGEMATNKKGTEGMVQRMAKDKLNITDLDFFMMVQHAKERNARVKTAKQMEKDAEVQKLQDELTALQNANQLGLPGVTSNAALITKKQKELAAAQAIEIPDAGSGMTDTEADNFMKEFEKAGKKNKLEAYAKEFRETVITKYINLREEAGDLSPEEAEALRTGKDETTGVDFEFYVPLKVKKEARKERVGDGGTRGAALEPLQRIKGTNKYDYTKRISPITQSLLDFQAAVKLAEDNKVAQSLYNLVKENPNSSVWEIVDVAGLPGGDFALPSEIKDNSVKVKIGGKVKYIKFNHQGLRDAWLKTNGNPDPFLKLIYRAFNLYKSYKRAMVTQYSIEFAFTNAPRDLQDVIFNASGLDIKGFTKQVMKNYRKSMQSSFKSIMGNLDPNSQMGKVIDEYLSGGGKISWMNYNEIESEQKRIQSLVAKYGDKGAAYYSKAAMKNTIATLGAINESVEMGTRIAVFKACRDLGISIDQAATISKNLSVNFNKKGTATPTLQALWLFSNAGFQSLYAGMKALRTPKGKKVAAITFGLGMAMPFIQETLIQLLSADDEEEAFYRNANSPEENANYYILPMGDRRLYRFPKSYGMMRVMFNSGYELGALYLDGNVEEHAASMASTIWSTMDPITGNSNNKLSAVMPTALRPWVEVNYLNRNYNDIPILPEEYGAKQNDYLRYYERTNDLYKDIAKNMYFKSGETIDVSPETLEYIVSDATGGIISTGFKTYEMVDALLKGTEVDKNKIPFYSKFVVDMKQQEYRYSKDFWKIYDDRGKSVIDKIRFDNAYKYAKEGNAIRSSRNEPPLVKDLEKKKREIDKAQKEVKLQKEQKEDYKKPKERK